MFKKNFINWFFNLKLNSLAISTFVATLFITMLVTNYITFVNEKKILFNNLQNEQEKILAVLSSSMLMPLLSNEQKIANQIVKSITINNNIVEITIKKFEKVFVHQYFPTRAIGKILTQKQNITFDNKTIGEITLRVSTNRIEKTIFLYMKENLKLFLFQLITTIPLIMIFYYYKVSKPVQKLLTLSNDIKNKKFSSSYEWKYEDELNQIGKSFEETKSIIFQLIITDSLTGIYNRFMLEKSLNEILKESTQTNKTFSITFFDVDDFKKINDSYGYEKGDKLLQALTIFVTANIDKNDIFGRWSAEEFLIIHPNKLIEEAYSISKNLQESINNKTLIPALHITCSFGISCYDGEEDIASLLKRCDKALFISKVQGKNRVITL